MTHGSLFSGIGGFDLAADWMGWQTLFHCDINLFCQKVLKHYWPHAKSYGDIKETDFTIWRGLIDIITGGFPCQPYSLAGERKGKTDDRDLWGEMLRAIKEIQPRWVVAENVYGLLNIDRGLTPELVCSDLEAIGYQKPIIFDCTSGAFGVPTLERHVWFISEANGERFQRSEKIPYQDDRCEKKFQGADPGILNRRNISESRFRHVGERLSRRLDKEGRNWIKAIGNAVPPQVAYQIFRAIEKAS